MKALEWHGSFRELCVWAVLLGTTSFQFVAEAVAATVPAKPPFAPLAAVGEPGLVAIVDGQWHIGGEVTYRGTRAEGLLMNVRMVNAIFEDANEATRPKGFDAGANSEAFIARIPEYVASGVRAFTLNLQGGMPNYRGAANSAFQPDGSLRRSVSGTGAAHRRGVRASWRGGDSRLLLTSSRIRHCVTRRPCARAC